MHVKPASSIVCTLLCVSITMLWLELTHASGLSPSNEPSSIQKHCDLCWSPPISEIAPTTTPRLHRQHPSPGSRPHRLPKGHYKLTPYQKHARPSVLGRMDGRRLPTSQPIYTIDSDTIRMGTERIRIRGIDTPELDEPGGQAARQRLEQLLQEGPIRIVPHGQDVYGRTVADVFVDGKNVAEILHREGYAKPRS